MHPIFKNSTKTFLSAQNKCPFCLKLLRKNVSSVFCNSKTCSLNNNSFYVSFNKDQISMIGFKIKNDYYTILNDILGGVLLFNDQKFNIFDVGVELPLNIEKIIDKINTIMIFK